MAALQFNARIMAPAADVDALAAWLDGLDPATRKAETLSLIPKAQRRLWALAAGRAVTLEQLVPPGTPPEHMIRHFGRNTLPKPIHLFEKPMCRPPEGEAPGVLWGFNEGVTRPLIGPGYFVLRATPGDSRGAAVVDYYQVPSRAPTGWPAVKPNERGLQRFAFAEMHDFLRRVSEHVVIGRAYKRDRRTNNCFVLCREG
ncbi:MAG: hypothetical protein KC613_10645 [Myxococcales bacterium]|nr:hypothetical protein [Myxococcales bacterium]MCB9522387.1 hypothetical protein [Myxococcales bacterium]